VLFRYSPDRRGENPREHLKPFTGILQADAYAGYVAQEVMLRTHAAQGDARNNLGR
jgi:hypothetical protein